MGERRPEQEEHVDRFRLPESARPGSTTPPTARHVPVLPAEVLDLLAPQPGQVIVDATLGAGGHARLLAERIGPHGHLIGLDQDPAMLKLAGQALDHMKCKVTLIHANFNGIAGVLGGLGIEKVDACLADLGISSDQLDTAERGFTFQQTGPLDMRMDPEAAEPASTLLARLGEKELADVIYRYGEERFSRRIARRIVEARRTRPLEMTDDLAELVRRCVPRPPGRRGRIDPATRVFQALRIAVNDELGALEALLGELPSRVRPGGRAAIISFHSLEDRLVKRAFRDRSTWRALTKKPVQASADESASNPRSRSAKLRAAERLTAG